MSEKIIILVADNEEGKHGEISVMDDPRKAERLVETLLEAGFERERIRVFTGAPSEFQVSQRPVVALMAEDGDGEAQPRVAESRRAAAQEAPPRAKAPAQERELPEEPAEAVETPEQPESEGEAVEVAAEAESKESTPVKFSSLFRSA